MASEAIPESLTSVEAQMKELRARKIYLYRRIPAIRAEIKTLAAQKKAISGSGEQLSKKDVQELIYCNQHLHVLRVAIESLDEERKTVLEALRELRTEAGKADPDGQSDTDS